MRKKRNQRNSMILKDRYKKEINLIKGGGDEDDKRNPFIKYW